jgi:hypothetical protein
LDQPASVRFDEEVLDEAFGSRLGDAAPSACNSSVYSLPVSRPIIRTSMASFVLWWFGDAPE